MLMGSIRLLLERERQTKGADLDTCKWSKPITKAVESRTRAVGLPFRLHRYERDGIASIIEGPACPPNAACLAGEVSNAWREGRSEIGGTGAVAGCVSRIQLIGRM